MTLPAGWKDDDFIIACYLYAAFCGENIANCELCSKAVCAYPRSVEKAKTPGWHLICLPCLQEVSGEHNVTVRGSVGAAGPAPWETA